MTPSLYAGFDSLMGLSPVSENSQQFETSALKLTMAIREAQFDCPIRNSILLVAIELTGVCW